MPFDAATVPLEMEPLFAANEGFIKDFISNPQLDTSEGRIEIEGIRYMWTSARGMTISFRNVLADVFGEKGAEQILYSFGRALGMHECAMFCEKFGLTEPMQRLAPGPVYFAYSGWAHVKLLPPSDPVPNEDYILTYAHEHSFEAEVFVKEGIQANHPICFINAGYSAGWCSEAFGVTLDAREITCEAQGDAECVFIMTQRRHLIDRTKMFADAYRAGREITAEELRTV